MLLSMVGAHKVPLSLVQRGDPSHHFRERVVQHQLEALLGRVLGAGLVQVLLHASGSQRQPGAVLDGAVLSWCLMWPCWADRAELAWLSQPCPSAVSAVRVGCSRHNSKPVRSRSGLQRGSPEA